MGFFSQAKGLDRLPQLSCPTLYLRAPRSDDYPAWAKLRGESRRFLEPWEPRWRDDELSRNHFRELFLMYQKRAEEEHTFPFYLFDTVEHRLLGGVTLFNIRRGIAQMASIGYWIGEAHAARGHMTQALALLSHYAFGPLHLHRLEAACLPSNLPSQRLLRGSGFREEGMAKSYLQIAGTWEDHILFGKLASE
jgi:[ribosomal protein S5]-alanine N-acetyltransferase